MKDDIKVSDWTSREH